MKGCTRQQQHEHEQQQVGHDVVPPGVRTTFIPSEHVEPNCWLKRNIVVTVSSRNVRTRVSMRDVGVASRRGRRIAGLQRRCQHEHEHEQQQVGHEVVPPGVSSTQSDSEQVDPNDRLNLSIGTAPPHVWARSPVLGTLGKSGPAPARLRTGDVVALLVRSGGFVRGPIRGA